MEKQANISNKVTSFEDVISVPPEEAARETCDSGRQIEENVDATSDENNHLDSFHLIEPPPLDWRSDSSSEACSLGDFDESGSFPMDPPSEEISVCKSQSAGLTPTEVEDLTMNYSIIADVPVKNPAQTTEKPEREARHHDLDHSHIQTLLTQLHLFHPTPPPEEPAQEQEPEKSTFDTDFATESQTSSCMVHEIDAHPTSSEGNIGAGLLFTESHQKDLLQLLEDPEPEEPQSPERPQTAESHIGDISELTDYQTRYVRQTGEADEMISVSYGPDIWHNHFQDEFMMSGYSEDEMMERWQQSEGVSSEESASHSANVDTEAGTQPAYKDVPGPCDPEDLLDGIIFGAKYLGSTQLQSDRNPSTNARMSQAQEAVDRIKAPEGESQPMTEVDLFISTQRIKVLSADTQEAMMDHSLQMILYIADIGSLVVLMVRRKPAGRKTTDSEASSSSAPKKCWMICHVFSSEDAHIIAQAIGQAFGVAYQQFLQVNGIKANELRAGEYCLGTQEQYNGDLVHFSRSENIKEICISKQVGEILGVAIVESGWGSILPTVVVANLLHGGAAERSGELSIGDRIMSVNGASLVGLPIITCQDIIRDLKNFSQVKLSIVRCPPVTMAIIKRPDPKYQLGFSVEDGIICSLMRGGIAERGGIRVGHRIIEINGQSVVATQHEKIIHILTNAVGEIHLKTMPVSTYRLLTGQEQPVYL